KRQTEGTISSVILCVTGNDNQKIWYILAKPPMIQLPSQEKNTAMALRVEFNKICHINSYCEITVQAQTKEVATSTPTNSRSDIFKEWDFIKKISWGNSDPLKNDGLRLFKSPQLTILLTRTGGYEIHYHRNNSFSRLIGPATYEINALNPGWDKYLWNPSLLFKQ
ncbi:MAG: hypothetical protein ABL927_10765, partial [Bdellovibrionales bacterium]